LKQIRDLQKNRFHNKNLVKTLSNKILKDFLEDNPTNTKIIYVYVISKQTELNMRYYTRANKSISLAFILKINF